MTDRFKSFPYTPDSEPTQDYQVANKKYVDSLSSKFSSSVEDVYSSIGFMGGAAGEPVRVYQGATSITTNISTSLKLEFDPIYFALTVSNTASIAIDFVPSAVSHTVIGDRGTITHASVETVLTSITGAITDITTSVADITTSVHDLSTSVNDLSQSIHAFSVSLHDLSQSVNYVCTWVASVSATIAASASCYTSASVETVRGSLNALSTSISQYQSAMLQSINTSTFNALSISSSTGYISNTLYAGHLSCSSYSWTAGASTTSICLSMSTLLVHDYASISATLYAGHLSASTYSWNFGDATVVSVGDVWSSVTQGIRPLVTATGSLWTTVVDTTTSLNALSVSMAATTASIAAIFDEVTASIGTLSASVSYWVSQSVSTLRESVNALSTSVSNYQSAMLTSISTNAIFVNSKISLSGGASINASDYIRFNIDSSTPLVVSAGQINVYAPMELTSSSVDLNSWGLTGSSISASLYRGTSISVSTGTMASVSISNDFRASVGYFKSVNVSNATYTSTLWAIGGIGLGSVSATLDADFVLERRHTSTGSQYGMFVDPIFNPDAGATGNYTGIGGYAKLSNTNLTSGAKVYGLNFGGYALNASVGLAQETATMSVIGAFIFGAGSYQGSWTATDVIGFYCQGLSGLIDADCRVKNVYGAIIDIPVWTQVGSWGSCSVSISNMVGLLVKHTATLSAANKYQVRLDGTGEGQGIFFNLGGAGVYCGSISNTATTSITISVYMARIYSSTTNQIAIMVGDTSGSMSINAINISQSALSFYGLTTPKVQQTVRPTTGWGSSLQFFPTVSTLTGNSTASLQPWMSNIAAFVGTMADRLCSIGIFRSS